MPVYDYLCDVCGHRFEYIFSIHDDSSRTFCLNCQPLPVVHGPNHGECRLELTPALLAAAPRARKIITAFPGITHGMVKEAHYNMAVGGVVASDREFRSELSRQSDAASERNGFAVNFQPIDHRDAGEHLGVTEEGLDSTYARRKAIESS